MKLLLFLALLALAGYGYHAWQENPVPDGPSGQQAAEVARLERELAEAQAQLTAARQQLEARPAATSARATPAPANTAAAVPDWFKQRLADTSATPAPPQPEAGRPPGHGKGRR